MDFIYIFHTFINLKVQTHGHYQDLFKLIFFDNFFFVCCWAWQFLRISIYGRSLYVNGASQWPICKWVGSVKVQGLGFKVYVGGFVGASLGGFQVGRSMWMVSTQLTNYHDQFIANHHGQLWNHHGQLWERNTMKKVFFLSIHTIHPAWCTCWVLGVIWP